MALARSASGPGGLSINTGSANLFGSSSAQPPPAGGLFGSVPASSAPASTAPTTSLFGSTTAAAPSGTATTTTNPPGGGGLFGTGLNTQPTAQAQTTPSMFGTTTATTQPQQATGGGGLFGSAATANPSTSQPQQTGGLFGSLGTSLSTQPQPQAGGSLFGYPTATQQAQTQQAPGGGLFGNTMSQNAGGSSLFGGAAPQARPSLFGGTSLGQPAGQGNVFGRTVGGTSAPGLTMGQSVNQQQQVVPGVRIDLSNLKSTTRFNDLQESIQKEIQALDKGIQAIMQQCHDVDAFMPAHGEQLSAIPNDVRFVARKYEGASNALSSDAQAVKAVRELVHVDAEHAKLSFKAVDNLKLPSQYHTAGLWSGRQQSEPGADGGGDSNSDLIAFFSKTADEMDEQLRKFQRSLGEIEMHMSAVNSNLVEQLQRAISARNGNGVSTDDKVADLANVLRGFEGSILSVASVVGSTREGVSALQLGEFMSNGA